MKRFHTLFLFILLSFSVTDYSFAQGHTLRVLDINVWSGLDYIGYLKMGEYETPQVREKRYQALVTQIRQLNPDIIGINEANKLPVYAERLAQETGYEAFYHVGVGGVRLGPIGLPWNLREGDAILAKKYLKPGAFARKQLSGGYVGKWATFHFEDATQIIAVRIMVDNMPVYVFATHWHASLLGTPLILNKAKEFRSKDIVSKESHDQAMTRIQEGASWRMSESQKTLQFIEDIAKDKPFILMGDFNAESYAEEIKNLINHGMEDAFRMANRESKGFTWNPGTNLNQIAHYLKKGWDKEPVDLYDRLDRIFNEIPRRIDYIFLGPQSFLKSGELTIKSSRVVLDRVIDGVHASDHYGIFAVLHINQ